MMVVMVVVLGCDQGAAAPTDGALAVDAAAGCPALTGAVVSHMQDVSADEAWAGDGTLHTIDFGITVRPGATLTLDGCAVVQIAGGLVVTVAGDAARPARLIARGTADRPVTIGRKDPSRAWTQLRALCETCLLDLSSTTVEGGGAAGGAMIALRGASDPLTVQKTLRAVSLTMKGATNSALWLERGAAFTDDSTSITVTGGGPAGMAWGGDLVATPRALATLPPMVAIHDNQQDVIRVVDQSLQIERDLTLRDVGVPYYFVFDRVRVHSTTATPRLTIEAGVELQLDDYLLVGLAGTPNQAGVLTVSGTAARRVRFTSSKPTHAAGEWPGLWLSVADGSTIAHATIEAAGGANGIVSANCKPAMSSDRAALMLGGLTASRYLPAAADFTDVVIAASASHGINAMWTSASFGPDVSGGFSFDGLAGCRQTKNGRTTGCGAEAGCLVP